MISTLTAFAVALLLDHLLGEPKRWHPLVGFGALAQSVEQFFYAKIANNAPRRGAREKELRDFISGIVAVLLLLLPLTILAYWVIRFTPYAWLFETLILYFTLGARSLNEHATKVCHALLRGKSNEARRFTSYLVSRDTSAMSEQDMSRATIESTLENGCDAVFAPLFWFLVGGAPAALFYRLANTLDAMWGYRTTRYIRFGWAAARLDDLLNFIPARLTALTYAIVGQFTNALSCWRKQGAIWKSPNAGPVMSSGAGALKLQLGGPALYHGELQKRPMLGKGREPAGNDIMRATQLLQRGILLWAGAALLMAGGLSLA
jgi:adenosylcobinamide-phosphate synthase